MLIVFGLLILGLVGLMLFGFYSMEIEDMYGDNQEIFYNSRQGDFVVNNTTKEFGEIRKTWTRFYVVRQSDTLDIYEWWDDKNIEIFRPVNKNVSLDNLKYEDINGLKRDKKLELLKKLR